MCPIAASGLPRLLFLAETSLASVAAEWLHKREDIHPVKQTAVRHPIYAHP